MQSKPAWIVSLVQGCALLSAALENKADRRGFALLYQAYHIQMKKADPRILSEQKDADGCVFARTSSAGDPAGGVPDGDTEIETGRRRNSVGALSV
jgi:hypothetical protein